ARGGMINPDQIHADLAHLAQIAPGLFRRTDVESIGVWLEWPVSDAFDKKLAIAFKEELGDGADARLGRHARRVCARRASVQNCRAGPLPPRNGGGSDSPTGCAAPRPSLRRCAPSRARYGRAI